MRFRWKTTDNDMTAKDIFEKLGYYQAECSKDKVTYYRRSDYGCYLEINFNLYKFSQQRIKRRDEKFIFDDCHLVG